MSGIYIKGMEMPKSCSECPLMEYDEETGCYCYLTNQYASRTRPDDCPLIEVPPHGRLIDANPIMKFIQDGLNNGEFGYDQIKVMGEIQYAPTIIPADKGGDVE